MIGGLRSHGQYRSTWQTLWRRAVAPRPAGFTVVEVLIVLAVTGMLFVAAAAMISGRQARTAFEQAAHDVQSQLQQTINEVTIGYYPNLGNFNCTATPSGPSIVLAAGTGQGTNSGCIFMGKVIQFDVANTDPEQLKIYTVTGLRLDPATGNEVSNRTLAVPQVIAPSTSKPDVPDGTTTVTMQNGVTTGSLTWGSTNTPIGAIGFVMALAPNSGGTLVSGSQRIWSLPINNTTLGMTPTDAAEAINANYASGTLNPAGGFHLCLVSAGSNESALITLGDQSRDLSVDLDLKSNTTCS